MKEKSQIPLFTEDELEWIEERAAILEYMHGWSREKADIEAMNRYHAEILTRCL